jgi:predicted secreted hydrolase
MNVKAALLGVILLVTAPITATAQGFAGMGSTAEGFATPTPNRQFSFPADHGPHPDYRIEWWYLTANLEGLDGTPYGLQWTLFRSALAPHDTKGWDSPQIWLGHAAVTTPDAHLTSERFARGGTGQAGVSAAPFEAWIDEWHMRGETFDALQLRAAGSQFAYDITLNAQGPLIFHGEEGYSVKSDKGQASYYYSQPSYALTGTLTLPDGDVPVTGSAWLDREWSSQPLAADQTGWDWFSLSFDTGDKLMGFRLRQSDGKYFTSGTWITAEGAVTALPDGSFDASPLSMTEVGNLSIPTRWQVRVPEFDVDLTAQALNPQAWMDMAVPYWEGPVSVTGSHSGAGYLEMTGYDQP